mmetsp:Transcript_31258/g.35697  ORF Transcript_31258/g.35697 Transcript_31258/m.35697 type:complete len:200 (-) Transcript_31258:5-604(-)
MEVLGVLIFAGNNRTRADGRLGNFMGVQLPIKSVVSEVVLSLVWNSVRNAHVHAGRREDSVDFIERLFAVRPASISAEDRVESSFINHAVEGSLFELETSHVHLLVNHVGAFLFVLLRHGLDDSEGNIDIGDVLVAFLVHLLAHPGVPTADVQNLEGRRDVLGDDVLQAGVSLVPVEGLCVSLVSVFPILGLSVLRHTF